MDRWLGKRRVVERRRDHDHDMIDGSRGNRGKEGEAPAPVNPIGRIYVIYLFARVGRAPERRRPVDNCRDGQNSNFRAKRCSRARDIHDVRI